jgi:hypothetical protein
MNSITISREYGTGGREVAAGLSKALDVFGSVAAGFVAVMLGTSLARGLAEPANEPAACARRTEPAAVGPCDRAPTEGGPCHDCHPDQGRRAGRRLVLRVGRSQFHEFAHLCGGGDVQG